MKQLILILHLVSGQILEITDTLSVGRMSRNMKTDSWFFKGMGKINVEGKYIYMNMENIEYIEELYVDIFDPHLEQMQELSRIESNVEEKDSLTMEQV